MIPTQTNLELYPEFGNNASKVMPNDTKYTNGFVQSDVLPAEWMNWSWSKNTKGITALNSGVKSMEEELNFLVTQAGGTPVSNDSTQVKTAIMYLINQAKAEAILAAHPVGSLYWTKSTENPAVTFGGGTWARIKDKFVWAAGDSDTIDGTGGAKTVTLTTTQIPSHNHGVTDPGHSHTITDPGHKHDLRDMTNKGMFASPYASTGGSSYYRLAQDSSHNGTQNMLGAYNNTTGITIVSGLTGISVNNTGGGQSHNNMPPYIVKYCWERTA